MGPKIKRSNILGFAVLALFVLDSGGAQNRESQPHKAEDQLQAEEKTDYYKKWLEEDVVYIIADEEEEIFEGLQTDEEREQFIEQFWFRRDPDPRTAINETKEEHYRRVAYANEHFWGARAGWKTDRGRIYIAFGPPDDREMRPSGGRYDRPGYEGGGTTVAYPFERWWYRHIPGIDSDIEIEFVDKSGTGDYRIALNHWEKDALLHVSGAGLTFAEEMGFSSKLDRPYFSPSNANNPGYQGLSGARAKDAPFRRMVRYFDLQKPPVIKYKDLKALVETQISYQSVDFETVSNHIRLDDTKVLVPVNVEIGNQSLTFKESNGIQGAVVHIYGLVQGLTGRVINEFEDTVSIEYSAERFSKGLSQVSLYQKQLLLRPGVYKMTLVLKDVHSGNLGTVDVRLSAPEYAGDRLSASSLILARSIRQLQTLPDSLEMYVLGDLKVVPNVSGSFLRDGSLPIYMQIYGFSLEQSLQKPLLAVDYSVLRDGKAVRTFTDSRSLSLTYFSEARAVLVQNMSVKGLPEGEYTLQVKVRDRVSDSSVVAKGKFKIVAS